MQEGNRKDPDVTITFVTIILVGIGLIMVFSASYVMSQEVRGDPYFFLKRQAIWALLGFVGLYLFSRFDYHRLKKLSPIMVFVSFVLLFILFIPGVGVEVNEATRWIGIGGITIQPSEFTKLAMIVFTAAFMSSKNIDVEDFWRSSLIPLLIMGFSFLLILGQPDMGTGLVIAATTIMIIILAGMPLLHLLVMVGGVTPIIIFLIVSAPYRLARLTAFMDPWADPRGTGWHIIQSLFALAPGGIFGVGLGRSRQKLYYLPEPHNDFIFAIIGEELGFIGAVSIIFLFFILIWRGLRVSLNAADAFGSLLAAGITFMIGIQVIINIGVVTGSIPITGLNLPFISAGGSSLFFNLCSIGILLNISRHALK